LKVFQRVVERAAEEGAKSIFLFQGLPPVFKGDGVRRFDSEPVTEKDIREFLYLTLTEWQKERFEREREIDYGFEAKDLGRFRVAGFFRMGNLGLVIRPIPEDVPAFEELLLPPILKEFTKKKQGLFLVTGPTGSGKSTTLASMVDLINAERPCHIVTVEDPIEFVFRPKRAIISQREVGRDTRSFSEALKRVLREDPDVILVGEIRDRESMKVVMELSETGHLVFSTLHTRDTLQTINRILDFFPEEERDSIRLQLSSALLGISAQRLIPRLDGPGFVPACEVLVVNEAIRTLIREGKVYQIVSLMESSKKDGMITMDMATLELARRGLIALPEAIGQAKEEKRFIEKVSEIAPKRVESMRKRGILRIERETILYDMETSDPEQVDSSGYLFFTGEGIVLRERRMAGSDDHFVIDYSILSGKKDAFSLPSFFSMEYMIRATRREKKEYAFKVMVFLSPPEEAFFPSPYFPLVRSEDWQAITVHIPQGLRNRPVRYFGLLFDRDIGEIVFRKVHFF
jgi:twitching motility protein PilT